jgi:hypothetical protein
VSHDREPPTESESVPDFDLQVGETVITLNG